MYSEYHKMRSNAAVMTFLSMKMICLNMTLDSVSVVTSYNSRSVRDPIRSN